MKPKVIITTFFILCITYSVQAQFLKKLKQKAEEAAERTILRKTDEVVSKKTEKTIDDVTTPNNKNSNDEITTTSNSQITSSNSALNKNTELKKSFYKEDAVVKLHENGKLTQTQYFDANEIAVRLENDLPEPGFIDSEGFIYGFKDGEYTKSSIVALQSQGLMVPTMMLDAYKLPPEPFMAQLQKQSDLGVTANPFNGIVEFAFIYKPDDFRYEDFAESKQTLNGKTYTKFNYLNEPGYEGSYVLFDNKDRLVEVFTKIGESKQNFEIGEMPRQKGESLMIYDYKPVEVTLPPAREVRMQGQGLMEAVMGGVVKGGNQPKGDIDEDDYDTSNSKGQVKSVKSALKNHKIQPSDLPNSYDFDWKLETELVLNTKRNEVMNLTFLIKDGAQYQATKMNSETTKKMGETIMLFDNNLNTSLMLIDAQGNKFMQIYPIPDAGKTEENINTYEISDLPSKTIIGYQCHGLQLEDDRYLMKIYHTTEAEITLTNFLNFSGQNKMNLPDIDSRIIKQFSNGLIMEMDIIDKKKPKNNVNVIAKSLNKTTTSIKPNQYKSMNLFSGAGMMNGN
ncbi:hypothetical protein APS56_00015 [Pseudalgibacter alginicilyticus]|uniref:Uncharacterized protein n=1 Tax=Pseudalgibacter alginicilyticus TaxID=1736674 RepID=A0A0N7HXX0_9FLAO|nr:DUF4412 domain-containing protein [Pseudalgibacter alginicilyticus]ALJ03630.1 hypothetical protein APS56_00015 [Pseudalgibacter alginicilyticus]